MNEFTNTNRLLLASFFFFFLVQSKTLTRNRNPGDEHMQRPRIARMK